MPHSKKPGPPLRPPAGPEAERAAEMEIRLYLDMLPQPDDTTCGPTCLHAVYRYYEDFVPLQEVVAGVPTVAGGGTVDVLLANHALARGYEARIYTYNLRLFDPTWFAGRDVDLRQKLTEQKKIKKDAKLAAVTDAYLEFFDLGGEVCFEDLSPQLLRRYLRAGIPILTGLSATYLYHAPRESGPACDEDDIGGEPQGHFVVLCGYRPQRRTVLVADPYQQNPIDPGHHYEVSLDRAVGAVLLGVLTYDANLLLIWPRAQSRSRG